MANRAPTSAQGLTVSMLNGEFPGRIEWRYRRWLAPQNSGIDLGLGVTAGKTRDSRGWDTDPTRGLTASAGISGTYLGADARFDLTRTASGRTTHGTYVTFRTGSRAAPIVTATGFAVLIGLFWLATSGGDY